MKTILFSLQLLFCSSLAAQIPKPEIDTAAFKNWSTVEAGMFSHDGNYVMYVIHNQELTKDTLVIKSVKSSWKYKIEGGGNEKFTQNNQFAVFKKGDSLCLLRLNNNKQEWISAVISFAIAKRGSDELLIYLLQNDKHKLVIRSLVTNASREVFDVTDFSLSSDMSAIFLNIEKRTNNKLTKTLVKNDLSDFEPQVIWSASDVDEKLDFSSIAFDSSSGKVAFILAKGDKRTIWYYSSRSKKSIKVADDSLEIGNNTFIIQDICYPGLSHDADRLFVTVRDKVDQVREGKVSGVDIWGYKDEKLQSQQLYEIQHDHVHTYTITISLIDARASMIGDNDDEISIFQRGSDTIAVVVKPGNGNSTERNWNKASKILFCLVNDKTGKRITLNGDIRHLSPRGKYLFGFDRLYRSFYVYDIETGLSHDISDEFPQVDRFDYDHDEPGPTQCGLSIAGWMPEDSIILLYSKYDIWAADPLGKRRAINLTHYYGSLHHIKLRFIGDYNGSTPIMKFGVYIISAFNERTKESGFYRFVIADNKVPKYLSMGPYYYEGPYSSDINTDYLQGGKEVIFLIRRESAAESPNYFATRDFISFTPVSNVYPEKKYNWLSSEVINWQTPNKEHFCGVLYKPEDFDVGKKYPIIITYYEKSSQYAFQYRQPAYSIDNINIPWFVSRGYVVFTPDIRFKVGYPGQSALRSVVSGTKYLSRYKWVNKKKIAISGHSWGGYETNYIITHCNLFCAALSASSFSDFISGYGSLMSNGISLQFFYELDQFRMGVTPWERPNLYVEASPIFRMDKVVTPLLMMNNKADAVTPFNQGVELFTALRRLHKRVWMLQYDGEAHSLSKQAGVDYTMRLIQFFDHYCKGLPAPVWMMQGVPARLKDIEKGFEVDTSSQVP